MNKIKLSAVTSSTKSFNSIINRLSAQGSYHEVLLAHTLMLNSNTPPDSYTFPSLLKACTALNLFSLGLSIHQQIILRGFSSDSYTASSLINFYAKFGHTENARKVFDKTPSRDVVPWTAIIGCYCRGGDVENAFSTYNEMRCDGVEPSPVTFLCLLSGPLGIAHVQALHGCVVLYGFESDIALGNSLLNSYSKCGSIEEARAQGKLDLGKVVHGQILRCGHNGLVDQGLSIFQSMARDFGVQPEVEHHACIVDLLCRAGRVEQAYNFYKGNFSEPSVDVLSMLLDACRANNKLELCDVIAQDVITLRPASAGNYVQIAHCYASMSRWNDVGKALTEMRFLGLRKLPGWSFIDLQDPTSPAAFLRLLFHDCQVQGCDASILLETGAPRGHSEMVAGKNFGIRKRETIEQIKYILEAECPGQVSCADIIALAAKESVALSGGPNIQIPLGRKDSTTCSRRAADTHLPSPDITVDKLLKIFMSKGLNMEESVAILGGHTLGGGHCMNIVGRLYNRQRNDQINPGFEALLRFHCPTKFPLTNLTVVPNDKTPLTFDNQYFRDVLIGKGLFTIDSSISRDPRTSPIVRKFAADVNYFFHVFSSAFVKLSSANVLTKGKGEVRRKCNQVN
ncbi:Plant peroxidase [Corchorus olitorius]|uniref:peroxidase n=1 Tax=Corchorus olitorius TaxID=93759 RepID=A0A1R3H370_9ROSI|nr:Plant peroxidase [Corchorus olitorius]